MNKALDRAFSLGFMVSRCGFNGECPIDELAPSRLEADHQTIDEFMEMIEAVPQFVALRDEAVADVESLLPPVED